MMAVATIATKVITMSRNVAKDPAPAPLKGVILGLGVASVPLAVGKALTVPVPTLDPPTALTALLLEAVG